MIEAYPRLKGETILGQVNHVYTRTRENIKRWIRAGKKWQRLTSRFLLALVPTGEDFGFTNKEQVSHLGLRSAETSWLHQYWAKCSGFFWISWRCTDKNRWGAFSSTFKKTRIFSVFYFLEEMETGELIEAALAWRWMYLRIKWFDSRWKGGLNVFNFFENFFALWNDCNRDPTCTVVWIFVGLMNVLFLYS